LYQNRLHPFLHEHEIAIDDFISSAHDRAKTAGLNYLKQAIELIKQYVLGLPPQQPSPPPAATSLSYTQSLIARFNLPNTRPTFPSTNIGGAATSTATDFYTLLASAVTAATASATTMNPSSNGPQDRDLSNSGTLIPPTIHGEDRMSFITAQRERLSILLSALDKEASNLKSQDAAQKAGPQAVSNMFFDETDDKQTLPRPASALSGMSKSRSELDFEKIEKDEEGAEEVGKPALDRQTSGSWLPWSWGAKAPASAPSKEKDVDTVMSGVATDEGRSSGVEL